VTVRDVNIDGNNVLLDLTVFELFIYSLSG